MKRGNHQNTVRSLLKKAEKSKVVVKQIGEIYQPVSYFWSDESLHESSARINFPVSCLSREIQRTGWVDFVNFWMQGSRCSSASDVVFVAIATFPHLYSEDTEKTFWPSDFYGPNPFFAVRAGRDRDPRNPNVDKTGLVVEVSQNMRQLRSHAAALLRVPITERQTEEEWKFRKMCGFLALSLLRSFGTTQMKMERTFWKSSFKKLLQKQTNWNALVPYVPPNENCLRSISRKFFRSGDRLQWMPRKIVAHWCSLRGSRTHVLRNLLSTAFLDEVAFKGMGLISLIHEIEQHTGKTCTDIMTLTNVSFTAASWLKVLDFMTAYHHNRYEKGYPWAKIISVNYFSQLNCDVNPELAFILSSIIARMHQQTGVWNSTWMKKFQFSDDLKAIGAAVYRELMDNRR